MTRRFQWDAQARLFTAKAEVARPVGTKADGFARIAAKPLGAALGRLGSCLLGGQAFCFSDVALPANLAASDDQFITLTGGTSGKPKLLRRSQASWIASFEVHREMHGYTGTDVLAVLGCPSHSLALFGVLEALHLGLAVHVLADTPPSQQRARLREAAVSVLYATPTQLRLLAGRNANTPLNHVRLILCGGGTLDPATRARVQALCPQAAIRVFYGAAETSFVTLGDDETPEGAVGRVYPGVTLQVRDNAGHRTDGIGEIWVKSLYLFEGYAADATADTRWDDGFLSIGELGRLDAAGVLWLAGRLARCVTIADQTVHLEAVEDAIRRTGLAEDCAVIDVADALRGRALVAVLEGDAALQDAVQLRQVLGDDLAPVALPRQVLHLPVFPRRASGKTDLAALRAWVEDRI